MVVVYSESLVLPSRVQQQQNEPQPGDDGDGTGRRPVWKQNQAASSPSGREDGAGGERALGAFGDDCMQMLKEIEEREGREREDPREGGGVGSGSLVARTGGDLLLAQSYSDDDGGALDKSLDPLLQSLISGFTTQVRDALHASDASGALRARD